jgi:CubicO group peptidase (beta-lactamase class C family)
MNSIKKTMLLILVLFSGFSVAQLPSSGGFAAAPDEWLLSRGQPWHHKTQISSAPAPLIFRDSTPGERAVVEKASQLFQNSSAKSMALIDGNEVVWVGYKGNVNDKSMFNGFSVGKTVTAMAVGKAICSGKFSLDSVAQDTIPELRGTDLGKTTVRQLLTMSSGTWEGNPDSTISNNRQDRGIDTGTLSNLDVLGTEQVSSAHKGFFGSTRKPGQEFAYRNTDPLLLGAMINKTTGTTFARWVEQEVLLPAGIQSPGIIGQDQFGFGNSGGGVRLTMPDWIRFAVWLKQNQTASGCFGDFVRQATKTQISNSSKKVGKLFDGYGYLTWTDNVRMRDSYWAVGHGGQRIGWNHQNQRMLIVFSNLENFMDDVYWLYKDWANVKQ